MDFYLDEREKRKHRRRLKIKIYLGLLFFLLLIIGAAYLAVYSDALRVKNLTLTFAESIQNKTDINKDELIDDLKNFFANQSKITEFLGPNNILIWNNGGLDKFQKNPEIAELTIEKDYFKQEIKIDVKERERFGVWCLQAQTGADITQTNAEIPRDSVPSPRQSASCMWFDKNSVLFSEAPQVEGQLINKVDDLSGRNINIGDSALNGKLSSNLVKIFDVLDKSGLGIKSLKLKEIEFQEIETESPPIIYFSLRTGPDFASAAIESLKSIGLDKIQYIDLRVENRAYYKLK